MVWGAIVTGRSRKPARPDWKVIENHDERRILVADLLSQNPSKVRVNLRKLQYHGIPEDLAVAAVEHAQIDEPDPEQQGWYNARFAAPRGQITIVYLFQVINHETNLSIFDAVPIGREQY